MGASISSLLTLDTLRVKVAPAGKKPQVTKSSRAIKVSKLAGEKGEPFRGGGWAGALPKATLPNRDSGAGSVLFKYLR